MFCKYCGNKIDDNALFCSKCGKKIDTDNVDSSENTAKAESQPKAVQKTVLEELLEEESNNHSSDLQVRIGNSYLNGENGAEKDFATARNWFLKASAQNNTGAMMKLAKMYKDGIGGEQNIENAKLWYSKAAENGNISARAMLQNLEKENSSSKQVTKNAVSPKSRTTALLLAILFGFFGGHLFYVKKIGIAIMKLIVNSLAMFLFFLKVSYDSHFFTSFICFIAPIIIWELFDLCIILFGKLKDSKGRIVSDWKGGFFRLQNISIVIVVICIVLGIFVGKFFSTPYNRLVYFGSTDDKFNAAKKMLEVNSSYDKEKQIKDDKTNLLKHITGKGVVLLLEKPAEEGNAEALFELGNIYAKASFGRSFDDIVENKTKAIQYYEAAAEKGYTKAYLALGRIYSDSDFMKAIEYYKQAGTEGFKRIADYYQYKKDFITAASYYLETAERGDFSAYKSAGDCYVKAGERNSKYYEAAVSCYQTSIDIGYKDSFVQFGLLYFNGYGVFKNYKCAFNLFLDYVNEYGSNYDEELSEENDSSQNLTDAKKALAEEFKKLEKSLIEVLGGVPEDLITAYEFLGFMYENGLGTPVKKAEARKYYELAAKHGSEYAKKELQRFKRN